MMKKSSWFSAAALAAVSLLAITSAQAKKPHAPKHVAKLAMDKARAIALAKVPGVIKAEELEFENKRWIYSFEIRPTGETKKLIKEVNLDADTGEQVGEIETEKED